MTGPRSLSSARRDSPNDSCEVPENCEICPEAALGIQPSWLSGGRELMRSRDFYVAASLGCLIPGYSLIWTTRHVTSMAALDPNTSPRLRVLVDVFRDRCQQSFGPMAFFEHGSDGVSGSGSCILHAHLHAFPCSTSLSQQIVESRNDWVPWPAPSLSDLAGKPYLYYSSPHLPQALVVRNPHGVESQFIRRIMAAHLGRPDEWDWALFPNIENLIATLKGFAATDARDGQLA